MKIIATALVLALVTGTAAAGTPDHRPALDQEEECEFVDTLVPDGATKALVDDGAPVALDVFVLLDGVPRADGREVMTDVAEIYEPLSITVVPRFRKVAFAATGTKPNGNEWIDSDELIALSKEVVGGERPAGSDVVYTLTSKELDGFTAGRADCIEGIKWPQTAFAVGVHYPPDDGDDLGPLNFHSSDSAAIAAHEIGHLLAAEHHEANCAEGSDLQPTDDAAGVCTVMFPDTFFIGRRFGSVEATVIRKTAVTFATP